MSALDCPKCVGKLQERVVEVRAISKVETLQGSSAQYQLTLDQCFVCGGVWFDRGELKKYLDDNLEIIDSPSIGRDLEKEFDAKDGPCPRCQKKMEKAPAPKAGGITMDCCEGCGGIWLDATEIDRLERVHQRKAGVLQSLINSLRRKS